MNRVIITAYSEVKFIELIGLTSNYKESAIHLFFLEDKIEKSNMNSSYIILTYSYKRWNKTCEGPFTDVISRDTVSKGKVHRQTTFHISFCLFALCIHTTSEKDIAISYRIWVRIFMRTIILPLNQKIIVRTYLKKGQESPYFLL